MLVSGCAPKPDAGIVEGAIAAHFENEGYLVREVTIGSISRNPIAEREYMAPLTYVVEIPSLVLEPGAVALAEQGHPVGELTYTDASVKIQALSPPRQGWKVSHVTGISLPVPAR